MQRPATSLLETIIREEVSLLTEQELKTFQDSIIPKPTAGSIQKFLKVSVDGQFGDCTAEAVANFIYGKNTGHGIKINNCKKPAKEDRGKAVELLYDRMDEDGWTVGAKTGSIFANNGDMANSIIKLMRERIGPFSTFDKIDTRYIDHPAYTQHKKSINKRKYGLDFGGRDVSSTTVPGAWRDSWGPMTGTHGVQYNPSQPENWNPNLTREELSKLGAEAMSGAPLYKKKCGLYETANYIGTLDINQLRGIHNNYQSDPSNMFGWVIDLTKRKKYGYKENGKVHNSGPYQALNLTPSCTMLRKYYPEFKLRMIASIEKIEKAVNLSEQAYGPNSRIYGSGPYKQFKNDLFDSMIKLYEFLGLDPEAFPPSKTGQLIPNSEQLLGQGPMIYKTIKKYQHEFNMTFAILLEFVPAIGWILASALWAGDAAMYQKEGEYASAGIEGVFALIPFIGRIPGIKQMSQKWWKSFAETSATVKFEKMTVFEQTVIKALNENRALIKSKLNKYIRKELTSNLPKILNLNKIKSNPIEIILRKIANGTLDMSIMLTKFGIRITPYMAAMDAWEILFKITGLDKKQFEALEDREVHELLNKKFIVNPDGTAEFTD